ncbi:nSTAND1 domain-containing NTPase [Streptomyces roseolilacinus]|uniref:HTH cro/C1-type domain-containing protein n=1 Tax=Streptomyces roseolilacinus TaxID=66904 RepID=A0A918B6D7_9ACTN|nr:DNA-binding protein [Streptomyces roseolilacinus]GGQ33006.1 hypothetical protein GCM10010249_59460 [Streptomyces roseolilacinus]
MGRPETDLDPAQGPVPRFAYELRRLRQEAGGIPYREMARQVEVSVSTLSRAAKGEQLPSLSVTLAYVAACKGDTAEWEKRWKAVAAEVAAAPRAADGEEPPYRGMTRFEPGDSELFFGREQVVDDVLERLRARRCAAVLGPSGSGKSSLLRAGVVPRLRRPEPPEPGPAALRILTPGQHPARTHIGKLEPAGPGPTYVLVDQFEELFTLCADPAERERFIRRLLAARHPDSRLRVVLGIRADFYGHCLRYPHLVDLLKDAAVPVGAMGPAELRQAIVKPAATRNVIVERALTTRLVEEIADEPGGLPLLSHALLETWHRRSGRTMTLRAYEAAGGVRGAIAQTAEDVYGCLSPERAELARLILLRLVTPGEGAQDTRRPVNRAELDFAPEEEVGAVLDRLIDARLLTVDDGTVDLAHEALITAWPRLRGWVDEGRDRLRAHRRLTEAARAWDDLDRDPGALYRGTRLETVEELFGTATHGAALTSLERSFLDAARSARTRDRRRRRGIATALAALMALVLVAGVVAWQEGRTSDRRKVEAEARRIAAVADSMRFSDPVRAIRLSVAAFRLADTAETRSALLSAAMQRELDVFTVPDPEEGQAVHHLTADGRTLTTVTPRRVVTWDVRTHRRTHTYPGIGRPREDDDIESSTRVSPDGRIIALLGEDRVRLWDVRSGRVTQEVRSPGMPLEAVFGPDGRTLVVLGDDIEVWDLPRSRQILRVPLSQEDNIQDMTVSADGRLLAVCGDREPLRIWDLTERRRVRLPRAAEVASSSCRRHTFALHPAGDLLALATATGIRTWELASGQELLGLDVESVEALRFSADGRFIAVVTGVDEIQLWRTPARQESLLTQDPVFRHPLLSESAYALRVDVAQGVIRYASRNGTTVRSLHLGQTVTDRWRADPASAGKWSEDGRTLAVLHVKGGQRKLELLNGRTGRLISALPGAVCPSAYLGLCTEVMSFSADGRYFAYGPARSAYSPEAPPHQQITVWDVVNRRRHASLVLPQVKEDGSQPGISRIALSADGRRMVVARTLPDSLELWDVRQARLLRTVPRFAGPLDAGPLDGAELAFRSDGGKVVSTGNGVADLRSGRASRLPLGDEQTTTVAFSRDGRYLAVGDLQGRVTIWDGDLRRRLGVLAGANTGGRHGYGASVTALAFSPDSGLLAVGGNYGALQIWDTASNQAVGSALPTPGDHVLSLAFGTSGKTLHAAGTHVLLQKYDLNQAHLLKQACARARGGLSPTDWRTDLPGVPYRKTC